jgi:hypothetical protein
MTMATRKDPHVFPRPDCILPRTRTTVIRACCGLLFFTAFLTGTRMRGQSIQDQLRQLGVEELARDYLRPAADAAGYTINSGWYHKASVEPGFTLWLGLKGIWTFIPDNARTFETGLPATLTGLGYPERVKSATVFGTAGAELRSPRTDTNGNPLPVITLPSGLNVDRIFLLIPHLVIGSVASTELVLRGIPPVTYDNDVGRISFYGAGLKHALKRELNLPIDVALMAAAQRLRIGDIVTVSNLHANVHASVPLGPLTAFAGVGYESYTVQVSYQYTPPASSLPGPLSQPLPIALEFAGRNLRYTAGVHLTFIPFLDVTVEYSSGLQDNVAIGAGFTW